MIRLPRITLGRLFGHRRRTTALGALALLGIAATACAVQEENTYPIELFSEMHFSQAHRPQEPPRQKALADAVVFNPSGGPEVGLTVLERNTRPYDSTIAGQLYATNCSVCHGVNGLGDGPATAHLTSPDSFYTIDVTRGTPYGAPPNLQNSREALTQEQMFAVVNSGIIVMPAFRTLLREEDIWDIVEYVFDRGGGLGSSQ